MNKSKLLVLVSLLLVVAAISWRVDPAYGGSGGGAEQKPLLKTQKDMESYAIGVEVARNFKRQGIDFDLDVVIRGMKDVVAGNKLLLTDYDLQTTLNMITSRQRQKKAQTRLTAGEDNKKKGQAFLAENKTNEGVVTLPSGLQYKILKAGSGKKPTEADTVKCRYRGTLINGTEFGSSSGSGQPATLKVSEVIPGWREALKLMPVGSKWQLFIPSQLAYGQRGSGLIGPYETIILEIELVDVI
ncbi:MAG: FKBP-type peptidyl-prolyl cis-trans isomerase N-terminal domain-containing protein [Anaerolineales bacterium]